MHSSRVEAAMLHPRRDPPAYATGQKHSSYPILALSIAGIIMTAVLLLSYYVFVIKCCLNWDRLDVIRRLSRPRRRWLDTRGRTLSSLYPTTAADRGLKQSAIQAIPTQRFRRGEQRNPTQDCAVCINEFQDEERIRMLPNCFHAFHIDCIDTWLQTHANCPLCRAEITNTCPMPTAEPSVVIDVRDEENNQATSDTSANPTSTSSNDACVGKQRKMVHKAWGLGDECIDLRGKDENFSVQPIRRSFSMGSSSDRQLYMAVQEILKQNPHFQQVNDGEGTSTTSTSWKTRRVAFFSLGDHCRKLRNSVIPSQNEQ